MSLASLKLGLSHPWSFSWGWAWQKLAFLPHNFYLVLPPVRSHWYLCAPLFPHWKPLEALLPPTCLVEAGTQSVSDGGTQCVSGWQELLHLRRVWELRESSSCQNLKNCEVCPDCKFETSLTH